MKVLGRPRTTPTIRLTLLCAASAVHCLAAAPLICPAGGPIGSVDLGVVSLRGGSEPRPLRTINRLEEGDTIHYSPILRSGEVRKGEVTIVLVPAVPQADGPNLIILESKKADRPNVWTVPMRTSVVAYVYGPSGLVRRKVKSFLNKDHELIAQLADYAEKTAQAESLLAALASPASSSVAVTSALQGFSSRYGMTAQIDRNASTEAQALTMFRTLNPTLASASYDPISSTQTGAAFAQTAGLATTVAAFFFGSPVVLAAGGTAMAMQVGSMAFPNAEFRSSFAQPLQGNGLGLCGQRRAPAPHTKVAYIWATRVPNVGAPNLKVGSANHVLAGGKSPVPIGATDMDWRFTERARNWKLVASDGVATSIRATKLGPMRSFEIDVPADLNPGNYRMSADWDWEEFTIDGNIVVERAPDLTKARLAAASQDQLVTRTGKVAVTLEGADFDFVTKAEIEQVGDRFSVPSEVRFLLPQGLRHGPQRRMDLQIDASVLDAGMYTLSLTQTNGLKMAVPIKVLPPPPVIRNLPLGLNQGEAVATFQLNGERLQLIEKIEVVKGQVTLGQSGSEERNLTVNLSTDIPAGTSLAAKVFIRDRSQPLIVPDAFQVTGPRPKILNLSLSGTPASDVELDRDELPGGAYLSAMLQVTGLRPDSAIRLQCAEGNTTHVTLKLGQRYGAVSLQQAGQDKVFLSFDSGVWLNGCALQAIATNGVNGESEPFALGRIVRVPKIEGITFLPEGARLIGQGLETIERVGWSTDQMETVTALPVFSAANVDRQTLDVCLLPPLAEEARLVVWLRGDTKPRLTRIRS